MNTTVLPIHDITATIQSMVHRSPNGYTVLKLTLAEHNPLNKASIVATGHIPYAVAEGLAVRLAGHLEQTKYGEQFKIQTFQLILDRTLSGIERYLASGVVSGIGPATAKKILEQFGEDTFQILDQEPERLQEIPRLGQATIAKIAESWTAHRLEVNELSPLMEIGLTVTQAKIARQLWGTEAKRFIQDNPYHMIELPGIGFHKADSVALKNGILPDDPARILAAIKHILRESTNEGHCYLKATDLYTQAQALLQINPDIISQHLLDATKSPDYEDCCFIDGNWALKEIYYQERAVERFIREWRNISDPRFQEIDIPEETHLSLEQQAGILKCLQSQFSIITGLPGTGKTTMVRELLAIARKTIKTIRLAAPTGKAAKRLSESTGYQASTLHRLLGLGLDDESTGREALHDVGLVVVDEVSMMDLRLTYKLLSAVDPHTTKVIFIGDFNQLPSVGPGQILRDLVRANACPITTLTKVFRQAEGSPIISLAHAIYRGDTQIPTPSIGEDEQCVSVAIEEEVNELLDRVKEVVAFERSLKRDIQVLVPTKKKGVLSSSFLNLQLQPILNPRALEILTPNVGKFFLDDRVIQTANNYNLEVFNGEVGRIVEIRAGETPLIRVQFDDDKIVEYRAEDMKQLELAYALTIHKAQGSEFDTVILAIHTCHFIMLRRELIYTAITRAKRRLVVCTNRRAYSIAVGNEENSKRNTTLFR